jgi:hypothetical protein
LESPAVALKALREAGIDAHTLASLLANPLPYPNGPDLWFVDESSLVATMKANQTLKAAAELGIHRFMLVGDQGQHQGIEAGAPMRQFPGNPATAGPTASHRSQNRP